MLWSSWSKLEKRAKKVQDAEQALNSKKRLFKTLCRVKVLKSGFCAPATVPRNKQFVLFLKQNVFSLTFFILQQKISELEQTDSSCPACQRSCCPMHFQWSRIATSKASTSLSYVDQVQPLGSNNLKAKFEGPALQNNLNFQVKRAGTHHQQRLLFKQQQQQKLSLQAQTAKTATNEVADPAT